MIKPPPPCDALSMGIVVYRYKIYDVQFHTRLYYNKKMSYNRHYDSPILDELHNYFPEILYAPERFRSVPDLLGYVQDQIHRRFDLFTRGRTEFLERERQTRSISTPPLRPVATATVPIISVLAEHSRTIPTMNEFRTANDLLHSIMGGIFTTPPYPAQQTMDAPPGFIDPVVVRPTAEQIASATAIEIIDSDEEMCAICQDQLPAGTEALTITACDHRFHSTCIRTWLTGHVMCPVCRHDIRESDS